MIEEMRKCPLPHLAIVQTCISVPVRRAIPSRSTDLERPCRRRSARDLASAGSKWSTSGANHFRCRRASGDLESMSAASAATSPTPTGGTVRVGRPALKARRGTPSRSPRSSQPTRARKRGIGNRLEAGQLVITTTARRCARCSTSATATAAENRAEAPGQQRVQVVDSTRRTE